MFHIVNTGKWLLVNCNSTDYKTVEIKMIITFMSIIDYRNFSKKVQFLVENIKSSDILYTGLFSPQVIFTLLHFQFRPILNSPWHICVYYSIWDIGIRQVSNLPADNEGEGVKIKRGEYFPVYSNIDIPYHSSVDSLLVSVPHDCQSKGVPYTRLLSNQVCRRTVLFII